MIRQQELENMPYQFVLLEERYLEGMDTRTIIRYDEDSYAVVVWGDSKIFVINRKEPEAAVIGFDCKAPNTCK